MSQLVERLGVGSKNRPLMQELTISMANAMDLAVALEENGDHDRVAKLEESMRTYINLEQQVKDHAKVIEAVKDVLKRSEQAVDVEQLFTDKTEELQTEVDPKKHPKFREFRQKVWAVHHPDEALPDEQDEDLVVMQTGVEEDNLICPLTRQELEQPLKNTICGHTYSTEAILAYIQKNRSRKTCPVAGCSASLDKSTLEQDVETEMKLKRKKQNDKRQRKRKRQTEDYQTV